MNRFKNIDWRVYREEREENKLVPPSSPVENERTRPKALDNYTQRSYYDPKQGKFVENNYFETI